MKAYGLKTYKTCEYGCCFNKDTPEKYKHRKYRARNKHLISDAGKGRERGQKRLLRARLLRAAPAPLD